MAQKVKNLPAVQEIWVWFLGQEDSLEREMAVHSSILDWKIPWTNYMDPCSLVGYSPWGWIQLSNWTTTTQISSVQLLSRVRLCDPMDCSMPGLPVHHQLLELTQTHVHWVGDAIQPTHPLLSPSPPAFNLSQHQGLFQWVSSLHQVAKILEFQLWHQSFQSIFRTDFL